MLWMKNKHDYEVRLLMYPVLVYGRLLHPTPTSHPEHLQPQGSNWVHLAKHQELMF